MADIRGALSGVWNSQTAQPGRRVGLLLCAVLLVATACRVGGPAKIITISDSEFAPETLQAKVDDRITVRNKDGFEHTLTATDGSFDTGPFDRTRTFTVSRAGRFEYFCAIHPFMTHRFIVVG